MLPGNQTDDTRPAPSPPQAFAGYNPPLTFALSPACSPQLEWLILAMGGTMAPADDAVIILTPLDANGAIVGPVPQPYDPKTHVLGEQLVYDCFLRGEWVGLHARQAYVPTNAAEWAPTTATPLASL